MKYSEWIKTWLDFYIKPTVKSRTYEKYRQLVQIHIAPKLGEHELDDLSAVTLQKFTVELSERLSPNTVNGILSVLKQSLKKAVLLNICDKEYSDTICRPKAHEKKIESFSKAEQRKIEQYILGGKLGKLFGIVFCLYTGLRIGELLALKWSDFDFGKCTITINKTCGDSWVDGKYKKVIDIPKTECSIRVIPFPKQLLPHLRELKKPSKYDYFVEGRTDQGAQVRS